MTNEELRQEFEKLPEIASILNANVYEYKDGCYAIYHDNECHNYVVGAWYAYQAQHEKYTKIIKTIIEIQEGFNKANEMIRNAKQAAWQAEMQDAALKRGLCVLHIGENTNKSANAVGEVLFDKARYMIDNAAWTARQIDVREAILKQLQDLGVPLISENVKIHLDEQDSNHD